MSVVSLLVDLRISHLSMVQAKDYDVTRVELHEPYETDTDCLLTKYTSLPSVCVNSNYTNNSKTKRSGVRARITKR